MQFLRQFEKYWNALSKMRLKIKCLQLTVFSCVYLVYHDFIFGFPKTISQLYDKSRAISNDRICLGKKNIRIIIIGLQRHEDLLLAEYWPAFTGVKNCFT